MKNRNKGRILATGMCMALLLSGCKIGGKEFVISNSLDNREVFQIGEDTCGIKEAKVYPNDPCPCGSGKKYKKCCGK